jgi:hypothetical protein
MLRVGSGLIDLQPEKIKDKINLAPNSYNINYSNEFKNPGYKCVFILFF